MLCRQMFEVPDGKGIKSLSSELCDTESFFQRYASYPALYHTTDLANSGFSYFIIVCEIDGRLGNERFLDDTFVNFDS